MSIVSVGNLQSWASLSSLEVVRQYLASRSVRAYVVGGFLRDLLLGRPSLDVDVAVEADALPLARSLADHLGGSYVLLDAERQVGRVVVQAEGYPACIDLARLRGGSIAADLACRDFTLNAMAVELSQAVGPISTWPLLDPFGGLADLGAGLVRAVTPTVFQDDPVRPLRAIRMVAQLGVRLEDSTARLLKRDGWQVGRAAPERARDEFLKVLAQPRVGQNLRLMDEAGILCSLLPELAAGKGAEQPREHYWDVFTHNVETAARMEEIIAEEHRSGKGGLPALQSIPWRPWLDDHFRQVLGDGHTRATILKLTALLHDAAKPQTKVFTPDRRMRFFGHEEQGAELAAQALRRLRCSEHVVRHVETVIGNHLRPNQLAQRGDAPTKRAIYRYYRDLGDAAVDAVYHCLADYLAARGPWLTQEEWQEQCRMMDDVLPAVGQEVFAMPLPKLVDGHDLQDLFGLKPGPVFRTLLEAVREAQAAGEVTSRKEALALLKGLVKEHATNAEKA